MTQVVRVESDSTDESWTVEVRRGHWSDRPRAADVPADIRAALSAWPKSAEEEK